MLSARQSLPVPGALVSVPFTARGTQYAVVLGYTPAGRMKVHPYNRAGRMWSGTVRTIPMDLFSEVFTVAWSQSGLTRPEPVQAFPRRRRAS